MQPSATRKYGANIYEIISSTFNYRNEKNKLKYLIPNRSEEKITSISGAGALSFESSVVLHITENANSLCMEKVKIQSKQEKAHGPIEVCLPHEYSMREDAHANRSLKSRFITVVKNGFGSTSN